jgi:hypothetical protein
MRASILSCLPILVGMSAPALAQGLPSANLNSINDSLAAMGQANAVRQQQITNVDTLRMDAQRNVLFQPQDGAAALVILRNGRGFGPAGPRHNGGVRAGRTGIDPGLDRGICIGC